MSGLPKTYEELQENKCKNYDTQVTCIMKIEQETEKRCEAAEAFKSGGSIGNAKKNLDETWKRYNSILNNGPLKQVPKNNLKLKCNKDGKVSVEITLPKDSNENKNLENAKSGLKDKLQNFTSDNNAKQEIIHSLYNNYVENEYKTKDTTIFKELFYICATDFDTVKNGDGRIRWYEKHLSICLFLGNGTPNKDVNVYDNGELPRWGRWDSYNWKPEYFVALRNHVLFVNNKGEIYKVLKIIPQNVRAGNGKIYYSPQYVTVEELNGDIKFDVSKNMLELN